MLNLPPAPDPDYACCYAALLDPDDCTCWIEVVTPYPTTLVQHGPSPVRESRCGDCAYRRDSRERRDLQGDPLPFDPDRTFYCHDGMPRVWGYVHPSGAVVLLPPNPETDDYQPVFRDGIAYQANGQPGVVCAGWAADQRAYQRATEGSQR